MTDRYNQLEPRYQICKGFFNGCSNTDGVGPYLTSLQEIVIQAPLGLAIYYCYIRGLAERRPLELVHTSWPVAGVWYFYLSEAVKGFNYGFFKDYKSWSNIDKVVHDFVLFVVTFLTGCFARVTFTF